MSAALSNGDENERKRSEKMPEIINISKSYGEHRVLEQFSLHIQEGETTCIMGRSGCGKTTLLRMIAGFNSVDGGEICFDDKVINNLEAHKRDIGMVFQNYAIFPHLTVAENVAYGLKAKKYPKDQIPGKVEEALDLVQIKNLKDRKPNELSGGQQQRVALARAFVIEPGVLLMDEPLSNLDAKLRVQMRTVIKKLQRRLGITTIYVTHDQEEALAISDRIAVIKEGEVMQVGSPENIYKKPQNTFVAGFIGVSNFVECDVNGENPAAAVLDIKGECTITCSLKAPFKGKGIISARPEQLFFDEKEGLPGKIVISTFLGDFIEYEIELDNGQTVQLNEYTKDVRELRPDGQRVKVNFDINAVGVYDAGTQEVISW